MASDIPDLEAFVRTDTGKGPAGRMRRDGMVPGIVFGGDSDPLPISIPFNVLLKRLKAGRFKSTLFNLKVDGQEDTRVICRDVQRDVVKDLPMHVDLMRLRRSTKINLFIPVEFKNEKDAPGIRLGGVLTVVRPEIELLVTANEIPESLTVDLSGLNIGDVVTISSINLPSGTRPVIDRDFVIANISAPSALRSQDGDDGQEEVDEATVDEGSIDEEDRS
ncbi:MAG: 50S ribosomal protein L25/general stress protein Ctc [Aestuariivita sp.]|nr:50S ribosomal protein L25/general stress protein Ctc [Aestuariivita sp.]MCY4346085.1 50S ribosomal protein L25/general stress protein Ctc [Aestuariivita sp.]